MKAVSLFFIVFGVLVILFPEIIAYMLGELLIIAGINIYLFQSRFKKAKDAKKDYVSFGNYKIYR